MKKTFLLTGATDGIGLVTAKSLAAQGHHLIIHGRNPEKLANTVNVLKQIETVGDISGYIADFSNLTDVRKFADEIKAHHKQIDVLINNAGIYKTAHPITESGLDVRFVVNTIAPYLLTKALLPLLAQGGRVINLSSAAQAPVSLSAVLGKTQVSDMEAYAQSKLAITIWTQKIAEEIDSQITTFIAVNPGSLLASKMVKEGFGVAGSDLSIGSDILIRMSLEAGLEQKSGQYFDNDNSRFSAPHPGANDEQTASALIKALDDMIEK